MGEHSSASNGHVATVVTESSIPAEGHALWYQQPEIWEGLAIVTFFLLLVWKKIPAMMGRMLDKRINEIAAQLDNAQRLREEAAALLTKYQRDQRGAEKLAADMIDQAEEEVKLLAHEAAIQAGEMTRRRTRLAEQKIIQAENNAVKEIQQAVVDIVISAARDLIPDNMKKADYDMLILSSIENLDFQQH